MQKTIILPPIANACSFNDFIQLKKLLISNHPDTELHSSYMRPIHAACLSNSPHSLRVLLKKNSNPNKIHDQEIPPIMLAISSLNPLLVKMLLKAGADVHAEGPNNITAANMIAIMAKNSKKALPILHEMMKFGINFTLKSGNSIPIFYIAQNPAAWNFFCAISPNCTKNALEDWHKNIFLKFIEKAKI